MLTDDTVEDIHFLTQSPVRVRILELLREEGELSKDELGRRFDVSRVTIQRNVEALERRDWITNSNRTYDVTPLGELVVDEVSPLGESMEIGQKLRPFLKWVPQDSFDLDLHALADATIVTADRSNPTDWVRRHIDRIESASRTRGLLPMVGIEAWEVTVERTVAGELRCELVADQNAAEALRTDSRYVEMIDTLSAYDAFDLFVYDGTVPYGVGVFDRHVQLLATDGDGMPRALVETDVDVVREWALEEFDSYRERSDPFGG